MDKTDKNKKEIKQKGESLPLKEEYSNIGRTEQNEVEEGIKELEERRKDGTSKVYNSSDDLFRELNI